VVPTPIGNLKDITLRALEILREADVVLAEDTRTSGVLLRHYDIRTTLRPYHIHNEHKSIASIIALLQEGSVFALISDAGTPGINDPGYLIIHTCLAEHIEVEVLPGATAFIPALLKSGFPTDRFCYEGFLPHKKGRVTRIKEIADSDRTTVVYESPHRIQKLLEQCLEVMEPDRLISISRELTKKFEETISGRLEDVCINLKENPRKGEFTVVIAGKSFKE